jgi:anti-anti-sigma factor
VQVQGAGNSRSLATLAAAETRTHMFEIHLGPAGEVVMAGRLDAAQCDAALRFLNALAEPRVIDVARLEYIASAGLRVLLLTQKRLSGSGAGLRLINASVQIHAVFRYTGFDRIIEMTRAAG